MIESETMFKFLLILVTSIYFYSSGVLAGWIEVELGPHSQTSWYHLEKKSPKNFVVTLPISLEQKNFFKRQLFFTIDSELEQMKGRAQLCVNELAPFLLGPQGEQLTISLDFEGVSGRYNNAVFYSQKAVNQEIHSRLWGSEMQCHDIIHEVFHLLGLADEYRDSKYPCRPSSPDDSVMNDSEAAVNQSWNSPALKILGRQCEMTDADSPSGLNPNYEQCLQDLISLDSVMSPLSSTWEKTLVHHQKDRIEKVLKSNICRSSLRKVGATKRRTFFCESQKPSSLLYPAHFWKITRPLGRESLLYNRCTKQSAVILNVAECSYRPKECRGGSDAWLTSLPSL